MGYTQQDLTEIQAAYQDMLDSITAEVSTEDKQQIDKAFIMARDAHAEQARKSGEKYIFHPIAVARICAEEIGLGTTAIVSALLHDVVEDTPIELPEIEEAFNPSIAKIVDGLTKLDSAYNKQSPQAENFKKVLSTLVEDVRVVLIKMADRLHNMRTLGSMPRHKQFKIAAETSYIYAPLAHRLGLYAFKTEYLDLCMKITEPEDYQKIARKLAETKKSREGYIEEFIGPLEEKLKEAIPGVNFRIFGRPKSIYSIWNKIKNKDVSFEEIYDLFAVRIVLDVPIEKEKMTCWQAYAIITDIFNPVPERVKDWIAVPKANGYESLHTTVIGPKGRFIEVQIRTERMDEIAERGFAAHWKYKGIVSSSSRNNVYERWLDSVREILEAPDTNAVEFLGDFRTNNLFQEEIYVYTPKGDLIILPKGATVLDFAFRIHSEVGSRCSAAKVNNRVVPLSYELSNGDQVSVTTSKNQKPSEAWLKMVKTGKAKSRIRAAMNDEKKQIGELGKEALERKLKKYKVQFNPSVDKIIKFLNLNSHLDLYYSIAQEQISVNDILDNFIEENGILVEKPQPKEETTTTVTPTPTKQKLKKTTLKSRLVINGESADRYEYNFAHCCNPVQGDSIFAFLTTTAGLRIHRTSCPNATNLLANYGYRVMKAEWILSADSTFTAKVKIIGIDQTGVIEKISNSLSSLLGLNIRSFSISARDDKGDFEGLISLQVTNTDQLKMAMRLLEQLDSVTTVERIYN